MRIVASRIGVDGSGFVLGFDDLGELVRRKWFNRRIPDQPIVPSTRRRLNLISVVNKAVAAAFYKYGFPLYLKDEMTSAAQLSVAKALKKFHGEGPQLEKYLMTAGIRGCVDGVRLSIGRTGSKALLDVKVPGPLVQRNEKGEYTELEIPDVEPGFALVEGAGALTEQLAKIGTRRRQEIAIYLSNGYTLAETGRVFGVSESRVSQIASKIRLELSGETGEPDHEWYDEEEAREQWLRSPSRSSVLVSWR